MLKANTKCKICNKKFYARPSFLKRGWGLYCSRICHHWGMIKPRRRFSCFTCGKDVFIVHSKIQKSKSGKFFCDKSCQTRWRNKVFSGVRNKNWKDGSQIYRRKLLNSQKIKRCVLCRQHNLRVLAVHHVDQNRKNQKLENLEWLCHNCHYLVHHDEKERKKLFRLIGR